MPVKQLSATAEIFLDRVINVDTCSNSCKSCDIILALGMCDTRSLVTSEANASSPVSRTVSNPSLRSW